MRIGLPHAGRRGGAILQAPRQSRPWSQGNRAGPGYCVPGSGTRPWVVGHRAASGIPSVRGARGGGRAGQRGRGIDSIYRTRIQSYDTIRDTRQSSHPSPHTGDRSIHTDSSQYGSVSRFNFQGLLYCCVNKRPYCFGYLPCDLYRSYRTYSGAPLKCIILNILYSIEPDRRLSVLPCSHLAPCCLQLYSLCWIWESDRFKPHSATHARLSSHAL